MLPHTGLRREQLSTINAFGAFIVAAIEPVDTGGKTIQVLDSVYAANYAVVNLIDPVKAACSPLPQFFQRQDKSARHHPENGTVGVLSVS